MGQLNHTQNGYWTSKHVHLEPRARFFLSEVRCATRQSGAGRRGVLTRQ